MKNTFLKTIGATALAILMLTALTQILVSAQEDIIDETTGARKQIESFSPRDISRGLEGSWDAQVTFTNCQTGAALRPPFPSMQTYMQGGTMQEFGVGSGLLRGPGHGVWSFEGGRDYSNNFQFFRFNPDGTPAGRVISRRQIEFRPDNSYIATARTEFYDVNGNLFMRGCATETGTRFE